MTESPRNTGEYYPTQPGTKALWEEFNANPAVHDLQQHGFQHKPSGPYDSAAYIHPIMFLVGAFAYQNENSLYQESHNGLLHARDNFIPKGEHVSWDNPPKLDIYNYLGVTKDDFDNRIEPVLQRCIVASIARCVSDPENSWEGFLYGKEMSTSTTNWTYLYKIPPILTLLEELKPEARAEINHYAASKNVSIEGIVADCKAREAMCTLELISTANGNTSLTSELIAGNNTAKEYLGDAEEGQDIQNVSAHELRTKIHVNGEYISFTPLCKLPQLFGGFDKIPDELKADLSEEKITEYMEHFNQMQPILIVDKHLKQLELQAKYYEADIARGRDDPIVVYDSELFGMHTGATTKYIIDPVAGADSGILIEMPSRMPGLYEEIEDAGGMDFLGQHIPNLEKRLLNLLNISVPSANLRLPGELSAPIEPEEPDHGTGFGLIRPKEEPRFYVQFRPKSGKATPSPQPN